MAADIAAIRARISAAVSKRGVKKTTRSRIKKPVGPAFVVRSDGSSRPRRAGFTEECALVEIEREFGPCEHNHVTVQLSEIRHLLVDDSTRRYADSKKSGTIRLQFDYITGNGNGIDPIAHGTQLLVFEIDGAQHHYAVGVFGGEKAHREQACRDSIKEAYVASRNGILRRIPNVDFYPSGRKRNICELGEFRRRVATKLEEAWALVQSRRDSGNPCSNLPDASKACRRYLSRPVSQMVG